MQAEEHTEWEIVLDQSTQITGILMTGWTLNRVRVVDKGDASLAISKIPHKETILFESILTLGIRQVNYTISKSHPSLKGPMLSDGSGGNSKKMINNHILFHFWVPLPSPNSSFEGKCHPISGRLCKMFLHVGCACSRMVFVVPKCERSNLQSHSTSWDGTSWITCCCWSYHDISLT